MGGLLALGAYTDPNGLDSDRAQRDLKTGKVRWVALAILFFGGLRFSYLAVFTSLLLGIDLYLLSNVCPNGDWNFC